MNSLIYEFLKREFDGNLLLVYNTIKTYQITNHYQNKLVFQNKLI